MVGWRGHQSVPARLSARLVSCSVAFAPMTRRTASTYQKPEDARRPVERSDRGERVPGRGATRAARGLGTAAAGCKRAAAAQAGAGGCLLPARRRQRGIVRCLRRSAVAAVGSQYLRPESQRRGGVVVTSEELQPRLINLFETGLAYSAVADFLQDDYGGRLTALVVYLLARASIAASTFGGDIGNSVSRRPVARSIALAMAAMGGQILTSATPLAPYG
jgi:hypothetical protein